MGRPVLVSENGLRQINEFYFTFLIANYKRIKIKFYLN